MIDHDLRFERVERYDIDLDVARYLLDCRRCKLRVQMETQAELVFRYPDADPPKLRPESRAFEVLFDLLNHGPEKREQNRKADLVEKLLRESTTFELRREAPECAAAKCHFCDGVPRKPAAITEVPPEATIKAVCRACWGSGIAQNVRDSSWG